MNLLLPVTVGRYRLPNRVVMSAMTRSRALPGGLPGPLTVAYYVQRASTGLIVTEGTFPSAEGGNSPYSAGIYTPEQVAAWRKVTDAVHEAGGRIFIQLWHVGRCAFPEGRADGSLPVGPSSIAANVERRTPSGEMKKFPVPRALALEEMPRVVGDYRHAAQCALEAGADGVEIHAANGFLLDQFLRSGSNKRTDRYGGSVENRARLLLDVTAAVASVLGPDRVGVKISPTKSFNDMHDDDPFTTFGYAVGKLNTLGIAYLTLSADPPPQQDAYAKENAGLLPRLRQAFVHPVIMNGGYSRESAEAAITTGAADLVSFGNLFIANPDLVERFRHNAPLNPLDTANIYGREALGYTSYPKLDEAALSDANPSP
jgi:N-ethylmaleimide reductase